MSDELMWNGGALIAIAGTLLLVWALFGDRARGRRRCPRCWYDMSATQSRRCPECGHEAASERKLFKTRRQWWFALASVLLLAIAGVVYVQPEVKRNGWQQFFPNTALIVSLRSNDYAWAFDELKKRDPDALYQWQWSQIADACISNLQKNPTSIEKLRLVAWISDSLNRLDDEEKAREVMTCLSGLLWDGDNRVRQLAVKSFEITRFPDEATQVLLPLLDDPDSIRLDAILTLGELAVVNQTARDNICRAARQQDHWMARLFATTGLLRVAQADAATPEVFDVLAAVYRDDPHPAVRRRALLAMCWVATRREEAAEFVRHALSSDEPLLRAAGLDALAKAESIEQSEKTEWALKGMVDQFAAVRLSAASLIRQGIDTASLLKHMHLLRTIANDPQQIHEVREAAIFHLNEYRRLQND